LPSERSESEELPDDTYEMSDIDNGGGGIKTRGYAANRRESRKKQ